MDIRQWYNPSFFDILKHACYSVSIVLLLKEFLSPSWMNGCVITETWRFPIVIDANSDYYNQRHLQSTGKSQTFIF